MDFWSSFLQGSDGCVYAIACSVAEYCCNSLFLSVMHTALVIGKRNLQLKAVHRLPKSGRVYFCTSPKQSSGISLLILAMLALDKGPCVAILETDVPMPELQAQYGGYGDMFTRLLTEGAKAAALPIPNFTAWDILNHPESYPDPADFDAILITGSRLSFASGG